MNETSKPSESSGHDDDPGHEDDQRAIAEYYASRTYALTATRPQQLRRSPDRPVWPDRVLSPETSFFVGLIGLSVALVAFGAAAPILHQMVIWSVGAGRNFILYAVLDQTMIYPAIMGFVFATVTPMFWYGSVLIRCAMATLIVLPGCIVSYVSSRSLSHFEGYWITTLALFCVIAAIPVMLQLATQWTLSHSRITAAPATPVGTRNIMELTIVAALGCAFFLRADTSEFVESLLFFSALGALCGVAAISMLIAFLRVGSRNLLAAGVTVVFAFAAAFIFSGMLAFLETGWAALPKMLLPIFASALYGTVALICLMWLYLWWLRSCGWACINKADEKQARESETLEPWGYWFNQQRVD